MDLKKHSYPVNSIKSIVINSKESTSSILFSNKQKICFNTPEQKFIKPKLHLINSREKVSKSVYSTSMFVASITSSLVKSKNDSNGISSLVSQKSLASQILNSHIVNKTQNDSSSKMELKAVSGGHISKLLTLRDFRKSFKSLLETNSEHNKTSDLKSIDKNGDFCDYQKPNKNHNTKIQQDKQLILPNLNKNLTITNK